jgi:inner membrane protein
LDPLTHALVGLAAGSFSGSSNVISNPMALGCLIGSVLPDGDIIMQYWGDFAYLKNHRGASHSLAGMAVLSAAVAFLIDLIFPGSSFWSIFLWTYIGCLTHVGLDLFNSYGAKLFWPFYDKKIGTGLMLSFDPFLILVAAMVYWFNSNKLLFAGLSIVAFVCYLLFRQYRRMRARSILVPHIDIPINRIVLLPSMSGLYKWDFIAYGDQEIITGSVSMFARKVVIRDRFEKSESWVTDLVMDTKLGQFFKDFSKDYHMSWEVLENGVRQATLIDLRYYIKNRYMHHATVQFNTELKPVKSVFHPYHWERNAKIPV